MMMPNEISERCDHLLKRMNELQDGDFSNISPEILRQARINAQAAVAPNIARLIVGICGIAAGILIAILICL